MFDLRTARYFVAVAEELHFGRAAVRLQMSQPPLSQAIMRLEREVGATLLERTNRRVALTAAGRAFLDDCRSLLAHAENVAETPRLVAAGARARVSVGSVASALMWPLPQALELLRDRAPHIAVRVQEIDTHEAIPGLLEGHLDLALARMASSAPGVVTAVLLRDGFVALIPAAHVLAEEASAIDLADLADEHWIWLPREISPDYHDAMSTACRAAGFSPRVHHWAHSIASQIALVHCGAGVTIIPSSAALSLPPTIAQRVVDGTAQAVVLATTTRIAREPAEDLLLQCIEEVVGLALLPSHSEPRQSPRALTVPGPVPRLGS